MVDFNESLRAASLAVLRRELSDEERREFLELGAALGMNAVEDYLYILMIFKRQSDALGKRFDEISELERRINDTLKSSVERILGDGAERIGANMGAAIASRSKEIISSVEEFNTMRGFIVASSMSGIMAVLAYWFGLSGTFMMEGISWPFAGLIQLPAGWWMLFSFASYTYFWCFDHWYRVRECVYFRWLLALQIAVMTILLLVLL